MSNQETETPRGLVFIAGIALGVAITVTIFMYLTPAHRNPVSLVKTWEQPRELEAGSFAIDNGLYNAIKECSEANGVTSIEGTYNSNITCGAHDYTYVYMNWKWVPYGL